MYNPSNWYWTVAGDQTQVFSSASGTFVAVADVAYSNWRAADPTNLPTNIASASELGAVLAPYLLRPTDPAVLDGYAGSQADTVLTHLMFKIAFNHENRIRACERALALNGSPAAMTPGQARAVVKALM